MSRMVDTVVSSLLPATVAGILGGLGLTAFFAGRSYWWRGENLDLLGYHVHQAEGAATYSVVTSLLNLSLGVFVISWVVWAWFRWNESGTNAASRAEQDAAADGGRDVGSS